MTDLRVADRDRERTVGRHQLAAFHTHRTVYAAVAAGMVVLWALCGFGYFWPMWPILGWGSGLFVHGRAVRAV